MLMDSGLRRRDEILYASVSLDLYKVMQKTRIAQRGRSKGLLIAEVIELQRQISDLFLQQSNRRLQVIALRALHAH